MTTEKTQFPIISKPVFIGEFGNDHRNNEIQLGRSKLRYLHETLLQKEQVRFDLNEGFQEFDAKPNSGRIDGLLKYIMQISERGSNLKKDIHDCEFVTWRGTLTRISSTPFLNPNADPWSVACCRFKDVIFLCELATEVKARKQVNETEVQKLQTYWGHKFETYMTKETIDAEPTPSNPVSTWEDYSAVFKLQAKTQKGARISIMLGAEVDGINSRGDFIELKTQFQSIGFGRYWAEKEMKWWIQSYLVGIEKIIVGIRNKNGIVERLQEVNVQDLRKDRVGWEPATCMNYLFDYLDNIRSRLKNLPEGRILLTEYSPSNRSFQITEIEENRTQEFSFLHDYFIEHFSTQYNNPN